MLQRSIVLLSVALTALSFAADDSGTGFRIQTIEGWSVHINERLFYEEREATDRAIELLTLHLQGIIRALPKDAVIHLQKVPLWMSPEYETGPRAEYHTDASWMRANGRNPMMVKGVEFANIRIFESETVRMPCFVLHELAHAYHDQVLGLNHPDILAAYKKAVDSKSYDWVERYNGISEHAYTHERAYALTNHKEYFAESTEAFFGRNDFYPFTRDELERHDPEMFKVLQRLWYEPAEAKAKQGEVEKKGHVEGEKQKDKENEKQGK